jgi:hypothetical protein
MGCWSEASDDPMWVSDCLLFQGLSKLKLLKVSNTLLWVADSLVPTGFSQETRLLLSINH